MFAKKSVNLFHIEAADSPIWDERIDSVMFYPEQRIMRVKLSEQALALESLFGDLNRDRLFVEVKNRLVQASYLNILSPLYEMTEKQIFDLIQVTKDLNSDNEFIIRYDITEPIDDQMWYQQKFLTILVLQQFMVSPNVAMD